VSVKKKEKSERAHPCSRRRRSASGEKLTFPITFFMGSSTIYDKIQKATL